MAYLDDILIFGLTLDKLREHKYHYLQRLQENGLYVKLKKCEFEVMETKMLGFIVNKEGIKMEREWISTILDWPEPTTLTQVQELVGFVNFY